MKIIVCGSRYFANKAGVYAFLDGLEGVAEVVHGGATGADQFAKEWADERGLPTQVFPVTPGEWRKWGRPAGPRRNARMAKAGANLLVAFKGGPGTANMVRTCEALGMRVIKPETPEQSP
jgi:hypothetical protein